MTDLRRGLRPSSFFTVAVAASALLSPAPAHAQDGALSLMGGWNWGGSMTVREGTLNAEAAGALAGELAFRVRRDGLAQLYVSYQPSTLRIQPYGQPQTELYDMDVWYFMGGGTAELLDRGRAVPYGSFMLGASWFNPGGTAAEQGQVGSEWMFATMLAGGVRLPLGSDDRVQIRLDARMLLNIPYGGVGMWCGSGGCSGSFGGTVGAVQGSIGAGLRLALGETRSTAPSRGSRRRR